MEKKNVVIAGAGLVGSLLSIYLAKRGYEVKVFERRPDMRQQTLQAGRSINLALSDRGIRALEQTGIMGDIREIAIPMHGRFIHARDGSTNFQPYGKEGQFINSVSRGELNKKLMTLAEANGVQISFDHKCMQIDWENQVAHFGIHETDEEEGNTLHQPFDVLFGADGAYSAVRLQHQLQHDRMQYQQYFIDFGYKELTIPAGENGSFQLEKNALHIWPRGNYMLIALPNIDGSFTCTLFFPFEGEPSFASLQTKEQVMAFFYETFADVVPLMPDVASQFFHNPTSSLITVKCFPWKRGDFFTLIGDAAHAIVPFFGQGMNAGFEDCAVLDQLIESHEGDWSAILADFQELRKPDGDAIAELALNNFVEMRDKVADPAFMLQKKIEAKLHEAYPTQWIPAYSQVTFYPDIRYSEALENSRRQDAIMKEVLTWEGITSNFSDPAILAKIIELKATFG